MDKAIETLTPAGPSASPANAPFLVHSGWGNPENHNFLRRYSEQIGCRYLWHGLKDNVHTTGESFKHASMVAIWNGKQFTTALVAELCRKRGIPHWFFEQGLLPQSRTFLVDPRGFCGDSILNYDLSWVTDDDMERLYATRAELQAKYRRRDEGFVLAPLQIHNDSQVLYYSTYTNMDGFVADVEALYPGRRIVARPHPKGGKKHRFARAEEIFEGDFLSWAARASVVVGITSTCLYEAAILGVPVVALGDHPLRTHPHELHDRVCAGILALRVERDGDVKPILDRFGYVPLPKAPSSKPVTPPHLGGHKFITHTDRGALEFLARAVGATSMVDIGCGTGGQVRLARELGFDAVGIEGDPQVFNPELMIRHDFTKGPVPAAELARGRIAARFRVAWCVEVLEHIEEQALPHVFDLMRRTDYVVVTTAPPGHRGHHHVTLRSVEWWKQRFWQEGFAYSYSLTQELREASTMLADGQARGKLPKNFIQERGMVFSRLD